MLKKYKNKKKSPNRDVMMTELSVERTILAKQRTVLAEISILLALIGLSILLNRFYIGYPVRVIGVIISLGAIAMVVLRLKEYKDLNKKIKKIDTMHHFLLK